MTARPARSASIVSRLAALAAGVALLAVAVAAPVAAVGAVAAPPATAIVPTQVPDAGVGDPALARLASCVRDTGHLLVVFLIDESGSLRQTDPDDQRVAAAASALANLASLAVSEAGGEPPAIEVLLAGFSASYTPISGWEPLAPDTVDDLTARAGEFADRDAGLDTDFVLAFDGARADLASRADEIAATGPVPCQQVLLFTDGRFDIEARSAEQAELLGATKPYAPDLPLTDPANVEPVIAAGRERLCGIGGTMDGLRQAGAVTTTIALTGSIDPVDQDFLRAVSTGSAEGQTCGTDPGDTPVGTFIPAASLGELVLAFEQVVDEVGGGTALPPPGVPVCADEPCVEGTRTLTVDPEVRRVVLRAALVDEASRLELALPGGTVVLDDRVDAPRPAGDVTVDVTWLTPTVVRVEALRPDDGAGWDGTWEIVEVAPAAAAAERLADVRVTHFPGVFPEVVGDPVLLTGRPTPIEVALTGPSGQRLDPATSGDRVVVTAVAELPGADPLTVTLAPGDGDTLVGEITVPADTDVEGLALVVSVAVTTSDGAVLAPVSTTTDLVVASLQTRPVLSTSGIDLQVEGARATSVIEVVAAPGADACVWLSGTDLVTDAGTAVAVLADGASALDSCVVVPAGTAAALPLVIDLGEAGAGRWVGSVTVALGTTVDEVADSVDVPVAVETIAPVDTTRRWALFAGLVAGGVLLPLLGAWLLDVIRGRFRPPATLEVADVAVVVRSDGGIYRPGQWGGWMRLADEEWAPASIRRGRTRKWRGLKLWVSNSLSPFSPPVGMVRGPAPTAGSEGVVDDGELTGRLRLVLAGGWVFVLDADATRQATADPTAVDFFAAYGRLVVFRSSATPLPLVEGDLARTLPHRAQGLARTVRADRRVEEGTGQDMLDFIDAHVRDVRGLPRYGLAAEETPPEPVVDPGLSTPRDLYDFSDLGEFAKYVELEPEVDDEPPVETELAPTWPTETDESTGVDSVGDAEDPGEDADAPASPRPRRRRGGRRRGASAAATALPADAASTDAEAPADDPPADDPPADDPPADGEATSAATVVATPDDAAASTARPVSEVDDDAEVEGSADETSDDDDTWSTTGDEDSGGEVFDPTALRVEGGVAWRRFDSAEALAMPAASRATDADAGAEPSEDDHPSGAAVARVGASEAAPPRGDAPAADDRAGADDADAAGADRPRDAGPAPDEADTDEADTDDADTDEAGGPSGGRGFEPLDLPWATDDDEPDDEPTPEPPPPRGDPTTRWAGRRAPSWPVPKPPERS
ncbi:MAG TPA: hypothetical protein VK866_00535 [Acidimicrobiales bacterium]|nr:hypothetical protein [Acidimicrobiales bacterium]